jgi:hypothetical protein
VPHGHQAMFMNGGGLGFGESLASWLGVCKVAWHVSEHIRNHGIWAWYA